MKKNLLLSFFSILFCILIFFLMELAVRVLCPDVNLQGTDASLFRQKAFSESPGWAPNSKGLVFGKMVYFDENGFRKMEYPEKYEKEWLILGDSVAFGPGVETKDTFLGLLQKQHPEIKMWNTSVVGYSVDNYKDIVNWFLSSNKKIDRVVMFLCLNDIYNNIAITETDKTILQQGSNQEEKSADAPKPTPTPQKAKPPNFISKAFQEFIAYFRCRSKLFVLLKSIMFDRSQSYFLFDYSLYKNNSDYYVKSLKTIDEIAQKLKKNKIDLIIVILPYEYQLRLDDPNLLLPQNVLKAHFKEQRISCIDIYDKMKNSSYKSRKLFLAADAMHFSKTGHKTAFDIINKELFK